jgi:hypothetical protein
MAVVVACRGCGTEVALGAGFCFICRCPDPTCNASHLLPKSMNGTAPRPTNLIRRFASRLFARISSAPAHD